MVITCELGERAYSRQTRNNMEEWTVTYHDDRKILFYGAMVHDDTPVAVTFAATL